MSGGALGPGPEFDLIRRFLAERPPAARADVRVGPGDDCAVVAGQGLALSSDLSVEGVHFRRDWLTPRQIGYRAATAALSDLAAMAARCIGVLASLAVAPDDADEVAVEVMSGVREAAERAGGVVLGGDLTRSPGPLLLDVTVVGEAAHPVLRAGASPGQGLWTTGELGGAAAAVASLLRGEVPRADAFARFAAPAARVHEALWLRERGIPSAMIDLSDGLAGDVSHLAAASGVAVLLHRDAIPVHPAARAQAGDERAALALAVSGGEDYEILLAADAGRVEAVRAEFQAEFGVGLSRVGTVAEGTGVYWADSGGKRVPVERGGFQHFGHDA